MEITQEVAQTSNRFSLKTATHKDPYADLANDVIEGLSGTPKTLKPKYFYDAYGSKLFDQICETPFEKSSRPANIIKVANIDPLLTQCQKP